MSKRYFIIFISLLMVSCQAIKITKKNTECASLDWFEIGRSDGVLGKVSLEWQKKAVTCSGFVDNHRESYLNGWYGGVDDFCSGGHGFAFGKTGSTYNNVCPNGKEKAFLEAYNRGLKVFKYESSNQTIIEELQGLNNKAQGARPENMPGIIQKMTELESILELNQALISEINREMTENTSQKRIM